MERSYRLSRSLSENINKVSDAPILFATARP
jgi:hypothetical protein